MKEQASFLYSCPMRCGEIVRLLQMIASHPEFSKIKITINPKKGTLPSLQTAAIPKGKSQVNLDIPRNVDMPKFYGDFAVALNN